jgi:phospholipid/cholesterol/gamma-HCH transport system substrate-binding protein
VPRFADIPRGSAEKKGLSPFRAGVVALTLIVVASYFGFSKANPFASPYELNGVFEHANRLAQGSPVRVAGVDIGKVVKVEPFGDSGLVRVKMEIEESGLPIRKDAELKVRSRLFLEGNYFVDVHPGRPGAPELEDGGTIPHNQTTGPVQLSQVLTALQSETRRDLQTFLQEYSSALKGRGAEGFNEAIKHWAEAYSKTSQVSEATLGTEQHDLTRVLDGQGKVFGALSRDERALADLVTGLNDTIGGFARQEDNLRRAIPALRNVLAEGPPALRSLQRSLPSIRAFARDALPGARSSSPTLDAQIPFMRQMRRLIGQDELGGVARELRAAVPHLTSLNRRSTRTLGETRALASCQNRVLVPFAREPIPDPDFPQNSGEPFFEESSRALVGLSGESRLADANSPIFRVLGGGGPTTIVTPGTFLEQPLYSQALLPLDGVRPVRPTQSPKFRPDVACETQDPPNLNAAGGPGDATVNPVARTRESARDSRRREKALADLQRFSRRMLGGLPGVDPLTGIRQEGLR